MKLTLTYTNRKGVLGKKRPMKRIFQLKYHKVAENYLTGNLIICLRHNITLRPPSEVRRLWRSM
jgi:hypothetical protein